jgi:cob(I)alamin adenosyltransferase
MDTKEARELFTKLENLGIGELNEVLWDLDCKITDAESIQDDVAEITEEDRANLKDDEYFTAEAELEDAMDGVKEGLEAVLTAIEKAREIFNRAEELIVLAQTGETQEEPVEIAEAA